MTITKKQAMTATSFKQILCYRSNHYPPTIENPVPCKPVSWRANGKIKVWKTRPDHFRLPVKHGLYNFAYIEKTFDNDNTMLFEVAE